MVLDSMLCSFKELEWAKHAGQVPLHACCIDESKLGVATIAISDFL